VTPYHSHDTSAEILQALMPLAPDPERAECVRARCRMQLERSRRRAARAEVIAGFAWHVLAPVVVGGVCVLYTALLVVTTFRLQGGLH
jgi:hypothetical protein